MNRLSVLLDLTPVGSRPDRRTGLARYALNLAEALARRDDLFLRCCAWGSLFATYDFDRFLKGQASLSGPDSRMSWLERAYAGKWAKYADAGRPVPNVWIRLGQALNQIRNPILGVDTKSWDLVHSTYARFHPRLPAGTKPRVITVHDLTPLKLDQQMVPAHERKMLGRLLCSIRPSDWVVCVSNHTKDDFANHTGHPGQRLRVVYNGVDSRTFVPVINRARVHAVRERYDLLDKPFLLTLSSLAPHKNLKVLLEAWPSVMEAFPSARLVVAGGRATDPGDLTARIGLGACPASGIVVTGFIPDEDFVALASACQAFLFPSLYEGFGLPLLEAMSCGAPVIASNASSVPEVVGKAGTLLDPLDEAAWARAMCSTLQVPLRNVPSAPSLAQAARFSWDRAASEYRAVYAEACSQAA